MVYLLQESTYAVDISEVIALVGLQEESETQHHIVKLQALAENGTRQCR